MLDGLRVGRTRIPSPIRLSEPAATPVARCECVRVAGRVTAFLFLYFPVTVRRWRTQKGHMTLRDAEAQFADLYERHRSAVWLYCRRRVGADRADDAMSDVFLTVWRRIEEAPSPADALRWLYRISHLTIANHWRSASRKRRLQEKASAIGVVPPSPLADQVVMRSEVREVVALLDELKASDAEVLRLSAWEQLSIEEIAAVLDVSRDAAKQRLSRARRRLTDLHNKNTSTKNANPPAAQKGGEW